MATNFSSLRSRKNTLARLTEEIKKQQKGHADERFWKLSVDAKTKLGYAKIRFLDAPKGDGEDFPWVRTWNHGFRVGASWFIDNCPTTIGRDCPVCKQNHKYWNSGVEADKTIASNRKRKLNFISNILVLSDPTHPENNGKVFLFRYGQKIFDKIDGKMRPKFPDVDGAPVEVFDLWKGADFNLKSQNQGGFQNYDKSEFTAPGPVAYGNSTDADYERLWEQEYPLQPFLAPDQYKSFEELETRLAKVTTADEFNYGDNANTAEDAIKRERPTPQDAASLADAVDAVVAPKPARKKHAKPAPPPAEVDNDDDEDADTSEEDDLKQFFAGVLH